VVSGGQSSFILATLDKAHQRPECLFRRFCRIWSLALGNGRVEHYGEVLGPAESKFHICQSSAFQSTDTRPLVFDGVQHRLIQFPESLSGHRCEEIFAIRKVPIRGVVGHAGASGYFPQSKGGRPNLGYQVNCRVQ
jgi:hypothetical protein